ncbi:hypothetical protein KJ953_02005 [Patescibacteria group bacterium]|nr:hypothetical protein [Patescibacteria group bacterium]MBU1256179.1 hypothetical protein [Patescibacteria group bacterium]MBU1457670.1 hypothetical protein [Patescibacteria group bacterium]
MTQFDHPKPVLDNSFSAFIAGLTVGIAGALLLGTEEGKKITKKALDSIPEDLTKLFAPKTTDEPSPPQVIPEPPPPPPPLPAKPFHKPSPTFFSS